jgi:tetratricopeptide (TPR) repeat protein
MIKPETTNSTRRWTAQIFAIAFAAIVLLGATGCDKLKARDNLNKGVQAYKAARYEEAINRFQQAVQLDPTLINAKLYLATAFSNQYVPGVDAPDNNRNAEQAIDTFKQLLTQNLNKEQKVGCLKGIASMYFNMKKLDDAKQYDEEVLKVDPNDPETYYTIGVIDWTQAYKDAADIKSKADHKVDDDITKDKKLCPAVQQANQQRVTEGIDMLKKALDLRPDYDDAMAYMNLMYRRKADIDCGDPGARDADLKTANDWVEKTLQTKKEKANKQQGPGGIVAEPTNK